uniref:Uncharacterized protein n=1 Tax=Setaria italica TaxID=4555 RepID=A0A0Q3RXV3_SETIT
GRMGGGKRKRGRAGRGVTNRGFGGRLENGREAEAYAPSRQGRHGLEI